MKPSSKRIKIAPNSIHFDTKLILVMAAVITVVGFAQAAGNITVCPTGCNYESIQAAISAANPNDTIELQSGTYNGSVFLTKTLSFIGKDTGNGEPIVEGLLYTYGYRYSLRGFGFDSVLSSPNPYSSAKGSLDYWMGTADNYNSAKSYAKALEAISNALKIDPSNAVALNKKGIILANQGRIEEAIECYDQATKADPSFDSPWFNKGVNLYNSKDYEHALVCFDNAIRANPANDINFQQKALTLASLAKYDDALTTVNEAIDLDPRNANNWVTKSTVLYVQGKYEDALTAINNSIDLSPATGSSWQQKGLILQAMGQNTDADAAFEKARELGS